MSTDKLLPDAIDYAQLSEREVPQPDSAVRTWYVSPPQLMRWIPRRDRDNAIALLDFEPDVPCAGELRMDLRLAFKCLPVRQEGLFVHEDLYIGCTSASVQIDVEGEQITAFTPGKELTVNYKEVHKRTRASKAALEPAVEYKLAGKEGKLSAGGISLDSGSESVFESSFAYSERTLEAVHLGSSVEWRLDPPRRKSMVRDFMFCNLHLFAICTDQSGKIRGRITVRPSDLRFFGSDRRPLGSMRDLIGRFSLFEARGTVYEPRGIEITFSEETQ